jgi:hypothetical protein
LLIACMQVTSNDQHCSPFLRGLGQLASSSLPARKEPTPSSNQNAPLSDFGLALLSPGFNMRFFWLLQKSCKY